MFELTFNGSVGDAEPLREFLEPQVRDSATHTLETHFELVFEGGLALRGDAPEKLAERLSRFATSAAYVEATAEAAEGGASMTPPLPVEATAPAPAYELRVIRHQLVDEQFEVWQLPSPATPQLNAPQRVGGLRGRNLQLVEHRVRRRLAAIGVRPVLVDSAPVTALISEDVALTLGLLFRTLAPMRSRDRMRAVAEGIDAMDREEAAYWLGMAMHRRNPRRILMALRVMLTEPGTRR